MTYNYFEISPYTRKATGFVAVMSQFGNSTAILRCIQMIGTVSSILKARIQNPISI